MEVVIMIKNKKQKTKDKARDNYLIFNDWSVVRIKDEVFKSKKVFYRNLIKYIVEEKRINYNLYKTYKKDDFMENFNIENYI